MAANMHQMGGAGQMMGQQMRNPAAGTQQQMANAVLKHIQHHHQQLQQIDATSWKANVALQERVGKAMNLYAYTRLC